MARIITLLAAVALVPVGSGWSALRDVTSAPLFTEQAEAAGLTFVHDNGARGDFFLPEIMGSGVALFDYDGDGDLDVYLVQGAPLVASHDKSEVGRLKSEGSRLFRNDLRVEDGRRVLRFTDVTDQAGVRLDGMGMGVATGDVDNDGDVDLYVTRFGASNVLFRNNADGTFTDVTRTANADDPRWSTSAAFFDADRDGDLDLFVTNYVDFTVANNKRCADPVGERDYCAPSAYRPVPDRFFRNNGDGTFTVATEEAGLSLAYGNGLGVVAGDYNGDGWPDIYVANDATPNQLWINRGDGTFEDQGWLSGSAVNAAGRPEGSMGIASGDFDADGDDDLVVTNLTRESFVAYVNDGQGNFEDRRAEVGIGPPTAEMTGFGAGWFDYDRDGRPDLLVVNGAVNIIPALRGTPNPFHQINQLFRNVGNGRLREVTREAGPAFALSEVSRGAAFGDIDNDGAVDVVITNNAGPVRLLLNEAAPSAHWVSISLSMPEGNLQAIGARVGVVRKGRLVQWQRVGTDGSYLSANDVRLHFGLGDSPAIDAVEVRWPDGARERFTKIGTDRHVVLRRGTGTEGS
ncbi:MAG TPA: CRTAC1 family protein [Vicinamibacterales bacterium]